jgi:glycosyltransferase involved in cell wall biosynthesis
LLFPSRAEAYGVVACEAAAYGVPVLGSDVGGIPTIVQNGETGYILPVDAGPEEYATRIVEALAGEYAEVRRAARRRFETTLNWDAAGRAVAAAVKTGLDW